MYFFSIQKSIIPLAFLVLLGFLPTVVSAALEVNFEATPLFVGANVQPGDAVTRIVTVSNTGTEAEDIIFSVENTFSDGLADVMEIAVTSGSEVFVDTTFNTLFTAGEVPLGTLPAASSKTYEFTSFLAPTVGNEYQLTNLGFDLLIGFSGGETVIDNPPGGSGGGGGGGSTFSLFNEEVEVFDGTSANLTWNTNRSATSYAVCGNDDDGPFVLEADDELFGYVFASVEDTAKSLSHTVEFTDLEAGNYSCRVASRRETDDDFTVSGELAFTILPAGLVDGVTDSQPLIQGNFFQPTPSVAGVSSGGKGAFMDYDEYRAELDAKKATMELENGDVSPTTTGNPFIDESNDSVLNPDTGSSSPEGESINWFNFVIGLIALLLVWGFVAVKRKQL